MWGAVICRWWALWRQSTIVTTIAAAIGIREAAVEYLATKDDSNTAQSVNTNPLCRRESVKCASKCAIKRTQTKHTNKRTNKTHTDKQKTCSTNRPHIHHYANNNTNKHTNKSINTLTNKHNTHRQHTRMNKTHTTYKEHRHESSTLWLPHKCRNKQNKHLKNKTNRVNKQETHLCTTQRHKQNTLWPPHATTKIKPS